jgi:ferredoxin
MARVARKPDAEHYHQGDAVLTTFRGWCKGCDLCIGSCPAGILALGTDDRIEVTDISRCIFCGICAVRCPDFVFVLHRNAREAAWNS